MMRSIARRRSDLTMMRRALVRRALVAGVATATLTVAACRRGPATPTDAAMQFYTMLDALGVHRVPDATSLSALRPYISVQLANALAAADSLRSADMQRAPNDKPAFADGDVFGSLFEGRTSFRVASTTVRAETTFVVMALTNDTQKPAVNWRDTLVVVPESGRAVVADIRYGASWEFGYRGTLHGVLSGR